MIGICIVQNFVVLKLLGASEELLLTPTNGCSIRVSRPLGYTKPVEPRIHPSSMVNFHIRYRFSEVLPEVLLSVGDRDRTVPLRP